jgi:hypothetical protein
MDNRKYIGMDVHKEAIAIAVLNAAGKLVMESIIETTWTYSGFGIETHDSAEYHYVAGPQPQSRSQESL